MGSNPGEPCGIGQEATRVATESAPGESENAKGDHRVLDDVSNQSGKQSDASSIAQTSKGSGSDTKTSGGKLALHISLYEMPDGMYVASCAEVPHCRILRQNKEHAFQDAKRYIRQFLQEREEQGRPFELPDTRVVEF